MPSSSMPVVRVRMPLRSPPFPASLDDDPSDDLPLLPHSPSSSAATLPPPPSPRPASDPSDPSPTAALPAVLTTVSAHSTELSRLRAALQVEGQRLRALRAAHSPSAAAGGRSACTDALARDPDCSRGEDCPICLDKLLAPAAVLARCGHMFHRHCIEQHLSLRGSTAACPICRQNMHRAEFIQVMSGIPEGPEATRPPPSAPPSRPEGPADVVCIDDDGDEYIDLVDAKGPAVKQPADDSDGAGNPDGPPELKVVACAMERALRAVEDQLQSSRVISDVVSSVMGVEERLKKRSRLLRATLKKEQDVVMVELRQERRNVKDQEDNIKHCAEELRQREAEVNEELSRHKKTSMDWEIRKKELEVREREVEAERLKLSEEQLECVKEKRRYEALVKARQRRERDRREGEVVKKRRVVNDLDDSEDEINVKKDEESSSDGVEEVKFMGRGPIESSRKRVSMQKAERRPLDIFGSHLQRPSSLNRPSAPRRGVSGLSAFAPKRSKVQRPVGGIAHRPKWRP